MDLQKVIYEILEQGCKLEFVPTHEKDKFEVRIITSPLMPIGYTKTLSVKVTKECCQLSQGLGVLLEDMKHKINQDG